jgi:hypothetical protein
VRKTLGVPFAGETLNSDWMLADVHMKGYPYPDTEASVYWHKDSAFVIFPIVPGRYRVLADLPLTSGAVRLRRLWNKRRPLLIDAVQAG